LLEPEAIGERLLRQPPVEAVAPKIDCEKSELAHAAFTYAKPARTQTRRQISNVVWGTSASAWFTARVTASAEGSGGAAGVENAARQTRHSFNDLRILPS